MKFSGRFIILLLVHFLTADAGQYTFVEADHANIQYTGRIDFSDVKSPVLFWPGSSVVTKFEGTSVKILLDDQNGNNYYNVFIDEDYDNPVVLDCEKGLRIYPIRSDLRDTVHTIRIFRRTEAGPGQTAFRGYILDHGKKLLKPEPKPERRIEFIGNSITCGMGNESPDEGKDNDMADENNFLAYGAITARDLDAEYICTAKSGIGILVSWGELIMPNYYYRLNPADPESKWDFSQWTPDVVVINLFQNDSWLVEKRLEPVPDSEEIIEAYIEFVEKIRLKYPSANIFCALGSMDATKEGSLWPGYIEEAVKRMRKKNKDKKLHTYFFPFDGFSKHPRVRHHKKMAAGLSEFIKSKMNW